MGPSLYAFRVTLSSLTASFIGFSLSRIQTRHKFRHGVVHELRTKPSQHILLRVFERRLHGSRSRRTSGSSRFLHEPTAVI